MLGARDGAKMLGADSRQTGDFILGENLLRGFDRDHFWPSFRTASEPCLAVQNPLARDLQRFIGRRTPTFRFWKHLICRLRLRNAAFIFRRATAGNRGD
jgi:hypothetical protein